VILFERHVMHARLQANGLSEAEADALAAGAAWLSGQR